MGAAGRDEPSEATLLAGLNALAIDLAAAGLDTDPVPLALDRLRTLTGAVTASYSEYDPVSRSLRVRYTSADGAILSRLNQILGYVFGNLQMPVSAEMYSEIAGQVFSRVPDLTRLTLGAIPKPIGSTLDHVFGLGEKIVLIFRRGGELFGTAALLMPGEAAPLPDAILEIFANLMSAVLQRYEAEKRVIESEQRFRTIFDAVSDAIVVHDAATGAVVDANARATEMFGYSRDELMAIGTGALSSGEGRFTSDWSVAHVQAAAAGEPQLFEWHCRHRDGRLFWSEVNMRLAPVAGVPRVLVVVRDATARVEAGLAETRAEEEAQHAHRLESIGRLAGGVAHDFNNLLTAIIGNVELVSADLGPLHPSYDRLRDVLKAADTAASLTTQLLAFGRKQVILPRVLNLNDVLEGASRLLARTLGDRIELAVTPAADAWPVRVDPLQIQQVIVDLATNARDAMPSGGRLSIATTNAVLDENFVRSHDGSSPGRFVLLELADTGQGMPPDVLPHVFEPFYTTKALGKGSGLGLATVYGAVKQNCGLIEVESTVGQGTTVRVYLPAV